MKRFRLLARSLVVGCACAALPGICNADLISLSNLSSTYTQDFNTLASTGTSSSLPQGWEIFESGNDQNLLYTAGDGSSFIGDTYSFGSLNSSERALGELRTSGLHPRFGVGFKNDGSTAIESFEIEFWGEMWHRSVAGTHLDELHFEYLVGASGVGDPSPNWVEYNPLMFFTPNTGGTAGARDGNDSNYRTFLSDTLVLNLNPGEVVYFRWDDQNVQGEEDGLGIDDFSLNANFSAVPEPTTLGLLGTVLICGLPLMRRQRS